MITLLNLSQEERCCDLITRPPREQGMGVRETCLADVLFLRFNCELAGGGQGEETALPPTGLPAGPPCRSEIQFEKYWRVFCHSIPPSEVSLEEPALPHVSLTLSKGTPQIHQYCVLPSESPVALWAADGPMLVQTCSSMSKLVRKPTKPDGFTHPSDMKRNARASTFTLSVYWEIRKTTGGSQCVSLKESQVSFKQPSGQL